MGKHNNRANSDCGVCDGKGVDLVAKDSEGVPGTMRMMALVAVVVVLIYHFVMWC